MNYKDYTFRIYDSNKGKYNQTKGNIDPERFETLLMESFPNLLFEGSKKVGFPNSLGERQSMRVYALFEGNYIVAKINAAYRTEQTEISFEGRNRKEAVEKLMEKSNFKWKPLLSKK